jgi:hypothetical protein
MKKYTVRKRHTKRRRRRQNKRTRTRRGGEYFSLPSIFKRTTSYPNEVKIELKYKKYNGICLDGNCEFDVGPKRHILQTYLYSKPPITDTHSELAENIIQVAYNIQTEYNNLKKIDGKGMVVTHQKIQHLQTKVNKIEYIIDELISHGSEYALPEYNKYFINYEEKSYVKFPPDTHYTF